LIGLQLLNKGLNLAITPVKQSPLNFIVAKTARAQETKAPVILSDAVTYTHNQQITDSIFSPSINFRSGLLCFL
jgi:hypothetical protein